jgi:hypothetical protein
MVAGAGTVAQRAAPLGRFMLFFFELFLFVLVMLTLALGEFVSRWLALILWLVMTVFSLIGYVLARPALGGFEAGTPDEKWARTLLYNWRRSNVLLVLGALAVAGWYWLTG